uniref:Macaca fascicularis brain cDNA, clone: QflA-19421 n=1 Tax=Macaca fascicularis TaxID=9541 RepID=I7GN43_MACFA|nr:unnamed protein product [Macaca fascicularis]
MKGSGIFWGMDYNSFSRVVFRTFALALGTCISGFPGIKTGWTLWHATGLEDFTLT